MRSLLRAAAIGLVLLLNFGAAAQERGTGRLNPLAIERVARAPITRFEPRSDADRLGALSALNITILSEALGPTFSITPRAPFVAFRGMLSTGRMHFNASFESSGFLVGQGADSTLIFRLVGLNANRVMGDCAISNAEGHSFDVLLTRAGQTNDHSQSTTVQNGRLLFATPPIAQGGDIRISLDHGAGGLLWVFTGCEFTLLPAQ